MPILLFNVYKKENTIKIIDSKPSFSKPNWFTQ